MEFVSKGTSDMRSGTYMNQLSLTKYLIDYTRCTKVRDQKKRAEQKETYSSIKSKTCADAGDEPLNSRLWLQHHHSSLQWRPRADEVIDQVPRCDAAHGVEEPHAAHPERKEETRAARNNQEGRKERPAQHAELVCIETLLERHDEQNNADCHHHEDDQLVILVATDRDEAARSWSHSRSLKDGQSEPSLGYQRELKAEEKVPFDDLALEHDLQFFALVSVQTDHLTEGDCHHNLTEHRREGKTEFKCAYRRQ